MAALAAALSLLGLRGASAAAELLPALCEGCLREPLELDHFGGTYGGEPRRLLNPSREEFEEAARSGEVLIIENASAGTAMDGWSCAKLAEEFPDAKMRREYDWVANPQDKNLQRLGDQSWITHAADGEEADMRLQHDNEAPPFAPFYWGVREYEGGDIGPKKTVEKVKKVIADSVPAFMDPANADSLFGNAEFWLGAKNTGARAHMDSHCISTLSVVMSGERRWRIGPVPRMPKGSGRSKKEQVLFDDGVAYNLGWKPFFEFTVKAGEAVLFPPGWIHETKNIAPGCTAALTTQFVKPRPARYFRTYYQRLRKVGDLNPCWDMMVHWATLGEGPQKEAKKDVRAYASELFKRRQARGPLSPEELDFHDLDSDKVLTEEEFVESYSQWRKTEKAVKKEKAVDMPNPDMSMGRQEL